MTNQFDQLPAGPKLTAIGKLFIFLFVVGLFTAAYFLFIRKSNPNPAPNNSNNNANSSANLQPLPPGTSVEIGVAYGTEKKRWLEAAAKQFQESPAGRGITVNLIPMGSLEGAQAIVKGDKRITAWTPASSLYTETFLADFAVQYSGANPIAKSETLALTPMVFIFWDERYNAFSKKFGEPSFVSIAKALTEPTGWDAIASKPEWGLFKFAHTHPNQSSSGLGTLILLANSYHNKTRGLDLKDILDPNFQSWMTTTERAVTGLSNSTGKMVQEMILKGPSSYDCVFAYESTAIDFLKNAEGRWGKLRVVYPSHNLWHDNPYYVLSAPWISKDQQKASEAFMQFLLTEDVQKQSITHGFRPGNPAVSIKFPDSPFVLYAPYGISDNVTNICETPKAEVINNLLQIWQRTAGNR